MNSVIQCLTREYRGLIVMKDECETFETSSTFSINFDGACYNKNEEVFFDGGMNN